MGELNELTEEQARAYLQTCQPCRLAYERLGGAASGRPDGAVAGGGPGQPDEPLPIEAKDQALPLALRSAEREARCEGALSREGDWRERVGRSGRLLIGRQLAAAIAVLLVAASLEQLLERFPQQARPTELMSEAAACRRRASALEGKWVASVFRDELAAVEAGRADARERLPEPKVASVEQ